MCSLGVLIEQMSKMDTGGLVCVCASWTLDLIETPKNTNNISYIRSSVRLCKHQAPDNKCIRNLLIATFSSSFLGHWDLENLSSLTVGASSGWKLLILNLFRTRSICPFLRQSQCTTRSLSINFYVEDK